jgi:creatinine amidohydrolase
MKLGEQSWTQAGELKEKVVVLPLGSLEQHGHHMPLLTDTMIITEVARRAEAELGDDALFLPTLWVGASDHHRAMPGTVSAGNETYVRFLVDMLESLLTAGWKRIFLLNGHGGNITPGRMALYDCQLRRRREPDVWLAFSSWWHIAEPALAKMTEVEMKTVTHACELETSMILSLRPELVRMDEATGVNTDFPSCFYVPDFSRPSRVDVPRGFEQVSVTGAFGHPEIATAEKGEALYRTVVREVVQFIREFATWPALEPG